MPQINLPFEYTPRWYQVGDWNAREDGCSRFFRLWHRRCGKDKDAVNFCAKEMLRRVGAYWHVFPESEQGRKTIWDGVDNDGQPFLSAFPEELVASSDKTRMVKRLINGSIYQVVGAKEINRIVGPNPVGIILSEFSLMNPAILDFLRPIYEMNNGWLMIITTPRGKNHAYKLWNKVQNDPAWRCSKLTTDDTGLITAEQIGQMRQEGMEEEKIQQEFYCSFVASLAGAYYAKQLEALEDKGCVTSVPVSDGHAVHTVWDIGISDYTSIWFAQIVGRECRLVDFYQNNSEGLKHYADMLKERGYNYGKHLLPHDAGHRQLNTEGKSVSQQLSDLGITNEVLPVTQSVMADINTTRSFLSRCVFDQVKTENGYEALKSYTKKYSESGKTYMDSPLHDWSSHAADAFRYLATSVERLHYATTSAIDYNSLYRNR